MKFHGDATQPPFVVGQHAEALSFQPGFRGAWFRCKIKEIGKKRGQIKHALEYYDFPDEKVKWTKLYQMPPGPKDGKRVLILRPSYPPIYHKSQIPRVSSIPEVVVVVEGVWKVGDMVDWWTDGCYWSGRVIEILGNDKVQVELPPPPAGEGLSYEVLCKDLRPSLNWSPVYGWMLPDTDGQNCSSCARLIEPLNQSKGGEGSLNWEDQATDAWIKDVQATGGSSFNSSVSSHISANSGPATEELKSSSKRDIGKQPLGVNMSKGATLETNEELDTRDCGTGKTSCSDSVCSSQVRDASTETAGQSAEEGLYYVSGSMKKLKMSGGICLNSMRSDTLEAAVTDLEELATKVRWLRSILEFGDPISNSVKPSWKFVENRASSTPK